MAQDPDPAVDRAPDAPPAPRAFRLDTVEPTARAAKVVVTPESEPLDPPDAPAAPASRKRFGWLGVLAGALGGLALTSLVLWAQDAVIAAMRRSDVLGVLALGLVALAAVAAVALVWRGLRDWRRERRIGALKTDAAEALASRNPALASRVADQLVALAQPRPETAAGRARFAAARPGMNDPRDVLALAERELIEPIDRLAAAEIARAARQVAAVTAVSPRALIDIVFVLFAGGRLITTIAGLYGGRPGWLGLWRVARASIEHLLVTGGLAAGDAVLQQLVGQGLAARLSAKLGEGVLNGLMTARFGLAALTVCRPLPFVESAPPTLSDVAAGLMSGRDRDDPADPDRPQPR
jgi:putative membrane protein